MFSVLERNKNHLFFFCLLLFVLLINYFRTPDAFIHPQFWAEDAHVFYNQSNELGFQSLLTPYAGYLHLIQRTFSLLVRYLDVPLVYIPFVYNCFSWLVLAFAVVFIATIPLGFSKLTQNLIAISLVISPVGSEIFSNLTNIQWITAVILTILFLVRDFSLYKRSSRLFIYALVFFMGLTGPFSILLTPLVLFRVILFRDLLKNKVLYSIWFISASIQAFCIVVTPRVASNGVMSKDLGVWIDAIFNHLLGGYFYSFPKTISFSFFIVVFISCLCVVIKSKFKRESDFYLIALFGMFLVYGLAGLYSHKHAPNILSSYGAGERYFYVPYVLCQMLIIISFFRMKLCGRIFYSLAFIVSFISFTVIAPRSSYMDLHWSEYVGFADKVEGLRIPINPLYPSWFLTVHHAVEAEKITKKEINDSSLILYNIKGFSQYGDNIIAGDDSQIYFESIKCQSKNVLYELDLYLYSDFDISQLFFSNSQQMTEFNSISLPMIKGRGSYYFPVPSNSKYIRIDPIANSGQFKLEAINAYCLG